MLGLLLGMVLDYVPSLRADGYEFILSIDPGEAAAADAKTLQERTKAALNHRLHRMISSDHLIRDQGSNLLCVQVFNLAPGQKEDVRRQLTRSAVLEFRLIHPKNAEMLREQIIPSGYEIKKELTTRDGKEQVAVYLVSKKVLMESGHIQKAYAERDAATGKPQILFELTSDGARMFEKITADHVGDLLGIVLDGELKSAPRINEPITAGRGMINGSFDAKEAVELACMLENPLLAPVKVIEERRLDPSLEQDFNRGKLKRFGLLGLIGLAGAGVVCLAIFLIARMVKQTAPASRPPSLPIL